MSPDGARDLVFYDGGCGLCHRTVSFALLRDRDGTRFRFAPLAGETFRSIYPEPARRTFPDSIVIRTADGRSLIKSRAALHLGERLGGVWRAISRVVGLLPTWLLDLCYDGVARVRYRLFPRPADACPMLPPELRGRFLA